MAYVLGEPTVQQYFDANGDPLVNGTIEFYLTGTSTPTPVYSDSAGTSAGTSVLLNSLGAPANSGTAIALFFDEDVTYKIVRKDAIGTVIDPTIDPYKPPSPDPVNTTYTPGHTGGVARTLQSKLDETASIKDFGSTSGGGVADDYAAFVLAEASGKPYIIPDGDYKIGTSITLANGLMFEGGKLVPDASVVVTISGPVSNPLNAHIFDVSNGGSFEGDATIDMRRVHTRWFGATEGSGDCGAAFQAAVDFAEAMLDAQTIAEQNTFNAVSIEIDPGRWLTSTTTNIALGGIVINGAGAGATHVELTGDLAGFNFRHTDYLDGQNINNNGVRNLRIVGTSSATTSTNVGIRATICKNFRVENVRFENISVMLDLIACEEPIFVTHCTFWHNNTDLTSTSSLRILALEVNNGTANAFVDPDTGADYYKSSQIFLDNCEFRAAPSICSHHIYIDGCDGLTAGNCHLLGAANQLDVDPVSSAVAIANVWFSDCFFDGEPSNTTRNVYVRNKTFTTAMSDFILKFSNCKINGGDTENFRLDHADLEDCIIEGGLIDRGLGNYMINARYGVRLLSITGVQFRYGGGGPDLGAVLFDLRQSTFFGVSVFTNNTIYHDGGATGFPVRHLHVESDGTNDPIIIIKDNIYDNYAALTSGFIDDDSSPALTYDPTTSSATNIGF